MAGDKGFEPLQTESESVVLPLHQSALVLTNKSNYINFFTKSNPFFQVFRIISFICRSQSRCVRICLSREKSWNTYENQRIITLAFLLLYFSLYIFGNYISHIYLSLSYERCRLYNCKRNDTRASIRDNLLFVPSSNQPIYYDIFHFVKLHFFLCANGLSCRFFQVPSPV